MVRAGFFWNGSCLSLYEKACLSSFVRHGFDVRLHSFDMALEVPTGTTLVDARGLAEPEEMDLRTQGGIKGSLVSFSNIYRYRMLSRESGWWFDTDMFCLADSEDFLEIQDRSPGISVGLETGTTLNSAAMYVAEPAFAREMEALAVAKGNILAWGAIGPGLITEYYKKHRNRVEALPIDAFYPVHWSDVMLLLDPDARVTCERAAACSLCVHLNNSNLVRRGIPKDIMPCAGSYLEGLFNSVGAVSSPHARLPIQVIRLEKERARLGLELQERIDSVYASRTWRIGSLVRKVVGPLRVLWSLGGRAAMRVQRVIRRRSAEDSRRRARGDSLESFVEL